MDPFSNEAFTMVETLRNTLHEISAASAGPDAAVPGLQFYVFSYTSAMADTIDLTQFRLPIALFSCLFISFMLIATAFRAALIPVKLMFTVFLPLTWTYGAALYVYEDGVLEWTHYRGLLKLGDAGIHWTVFMLTPCIVIGLALDYDIFLFTRVWEFRSEGFGDKESIQLGLAATGPIISQAGLIFGTTFMMNLLGSIPVANQMGFILVFSILVDTFVVRTILVPSILSLSPGLNYWPTTMPEVKYEWFNQPDPSRAQELLVDSDKEAFLTRESRSISCGNDKRIRSKDFWVHHRGPAAAVRETRAAS